MKTCKGCPTPAKCKAAGKGMKSGYDKGGAVGFTRRSDALKKKAANGTLTEAELSYLYDVEPAAAMKYVNRMAGKSKHKASGSKTKSTGYNKGGYAKCGASNPPSKKR